MSAISDKYVSLGGAAGPLGIPETPEMHCPDGVGMYQHFKGGYSIYWSPGTGAHEVHGLIRAKWAKLGWEKSPLGYPTSDETESPTGHGRYSLFQQGAILWKSGAAEAFESHGAIRRHWGVSGYENGFLGFPQTDETGTPDGVGRFNHFEGGSIYWKPSIDAHEVHGFIRDHWAQQGWERNAALGYPISDEMPATNGNRYSDFENGVVYWKHGNNTAIDLSPFTLASKDAATVGKMITDKVASLITGVSGDVYIKSGPGVSSISDYSFSGNTVQNRNYMVSLTIGYKATLLGWDGGLPDPHSDLTVGVQLFLDKPNHKVVAFLTRWTAHTEVPFPTDIGVSAGTINGKLKAFLDPLLWQANPVADLPGGIDFLSGKTMPSGDFDMFIEPL